MKKIIFWAGALLFVGSAVAQVPSGGRLNGPDGTEAGKSIEMPKIDGSFVQLETKEVILLDPAGNEIKRFFTSAESREDRELSSDESSRVLKKLGLKNKSEVREKEILARYETERGKLSKHIPLKKPRLRFYDKYHAVKKEIILDTKVVYSTKVYSADWNEFREHQDVLTRQGAASDDGSHAIVLESYDEIRGITANNYTLEYFDAAGNIVWSKKFPQNKIVSAFAISEDGQKVATVDTCNECDHMSQEALQSLLGFAVYNEKGKEILHFPDNKKGEGYSPSGDIMMSPSGKYISVETTNEKHDNIPVFIDIDGKSFYVYDNSQATVYSVSDDGIVKFGFWGPETKVVDLKTLKFETLQ